MTGGPMTPTPVTAVIDPDTNTMTVGFTFRWNPAWSLDKCEAGHVLGVISRAIEAGLIENETEKVLGFSYTCFDPAEETDLGFIADYSRATCTKCDRPVRWTHETWRAPEFWEHVDLPVAGEPICSNLNGEGGVDGYVVRFANMLDTTIGES